MDENQSLKIVTYQLPPTVYISQGPIGTGIFAKKFIKKGEIAYECSFLELDEKEGQFKLILIDENGSQNEYLIDIKIHTVETENKKRQFYYFDSFNNHSCDPNTLTKDDEIYDNNKFSMVALKDIYPDELITCDYNLFEYDCLDKSITNCLCNTPNCLRSINGFRYLNYEQKKERYQCAYYDIFIKLSKEFGIDTEKNNSGEHYIYENFSKNNLRNIEIIEFNNIYKTFSLGEIKKGCIIYSNTRKLIPSNTYIIHQIEKKRFWYDNYLEAFYYGIDNYLEESDDPNCQMIFNSTNQYNLVATKDILPGECLTILIGQINKLI